MATQRLSGLYTSARRWLEVSRTLLVILMVVVSVVDITASMVCESWVARVSPSQ